MRIVTLPIGSAHTNATLTLYLREESSPLILICPGGGFTSINEQETDSVALPLLNEGFHVGIFRYGVGFGYSTFPTPMLDLLAAVLTLRSEPHRWSIHQEKIFLLGFSVGAYIATYASIHYRNPAICDILGVSPEILRPDGIILGYPILDFKSLYNRHCLGQSSTSTDINLMLQSIWGSASPDMKAFKQWDIFSKIDPNFPPAFIWALRQDAIASYDDSIKLLSRLDQNQNAEYHLFNGTNHGKPMEPSCKLWLCAAIQWLRALPCSI